MTLSGYWNSKLPDYYPTMYQDGYTPEQVMQAFHNTQYKEIQKRREAEIERQQQERFEKEAFKMIENNFEKAVNQANADVFKNWMK